MSRDGDPRGINGAQVGIFFRGEEVFSMDGVCPKNKFSWRMYVMGKSVPPYVNIVSD